MVLNYTISSFSSCKSVTEMRKVVNDLVCILMNNFHFYSNNRDRFQACKDDRLRGVSSVGRSIVSFSVFRNVCYVKAAVPFRS